MADMEKAIVDFEKAYWREAIELFKESSDRDEKQTASFLKEWDRPEEIKEFFENTKRRADKEYSPRFGRILEKIEVAMSVGDIAIKGAPESVGLAWMGVRMCLSTLSDDHATFGIFGQASLDIMGIMISCAVFSKMYGPSRNIEALNTKDIHSQVTERIPKVYSAILDFSFSLKKYKSQHRGERFFRGLLRSATEKFSEKLKTIQDHDEQMSKFATIASQQLTDYNQKVALESQKLMAGSLDDIKAQLQESLRLKEAQAEDFQTLRALLADINKDMTPHDVALKNFEQNMLKLNAASNQNADFRAKIARRLPEQTCTWIFDQPAFCDWYDSAESAMLWISGGPGFGKSILMATIIDELQKRALQAETAGHVVVYFFCNRGAEITREADSIMDHLLSQLYAHFNDLPTESLDKANKLVTQRLGVRGQHGSEKASDSTDFADVFRGLVALLGRPVFVVVDAIDECTNRSIGFVETLRSMVGADSSRPGPKMVICSRPEQDILEALGRVSTIPVENNNGPDIKLNAERQLSGLAGWSAQERQLACEKIVKQAGSYFRYVDLALDFLRQPWQRPLSTHLEQLPEGVNAFYEQIVQKTPPAYAELLRYSLTWTILGGGSVRVPEVIDAYSRIYTIAESDGHDAGEESSGSVWARDESEGEEQTSDLQIQQIQAAGVNLLLVDPKTLTIQQRHSTVSDYFLSRTTSDDKAGLQSGPRCVNCEKSLNVNNQFDISEKSGHLLIASTILKHLMNEKFRQKYLVPKEERLERNEPLPDDPDASVNPATETSQGQAIDLDGETKSENAERSPQEVDASQTSIGRVTDPELELKQSVAKVDDQDPKVNAEQTDEDQMDVDADQRSDLALEIGTIADSDVDQADPVVWDYSLKLPEEYRYEVNYCHFHLTKVEELWQPEDRHGSAWDEFEALRDDFFRDDSVFFRSWSNLLRQVRWGWSWPSQALHCAARLGLSSLVERLVAKGTNLTKLDDSDSALDYAVQYYAKAKENPVSNANCLRLFEILLRAGIDINMRSEKDYIKFLTFRFLLVQNPNIDAVELFLKYGGDAKAINDGYRISVLHTCVYFSEKEEVLAAILAAGADPNVKDDSGETPLHALMQRLEVPEGFLQQLLDANANVNEEDLASQRPLYEVCSASGNVAAAQLLIEHDADITDTDVNGQTALHVACQSGHKDLVIFLIQQGAKIDGLDAQNRTPFFLSCCAERDEAALYLIEHMTDSDAEVLKIASKEGKTPLRKAAAKGHERIVQALYEKLGSDISILNEQDIKYQQTALHVAARNGRKNVVEYLLRNKAATKLKDKFGRTALAACLNGWMPTSSSDYKDICTLLIDANSDSEVDNGIIQGAAMKGDLPILEKLLDKGADPNLPDEHGWTAIQTAKQYGKMDAVNLLSSRNVSTALRPTRLRLSKRQDSVMKPQKYDRSGLKATDCLAIANHPIPADVAGFYYEVLIEGPANMPDEAISASLGLCAHQSPKRTGWSPGGSPYQSWGWDGSIGRRISYPSDDKVDIRNSSLLFGKNDVVGCGLDTARHSVFFTKNGKLLFTTKAGARSTYYAFTSLSGRLYPVILPFLETTVEVNFGNDKEKPFVWLPGNDRDGGVSQVAREEEELDN